MKGIRRLSLAATATAVGLVTIGAVVRASGSGLGCPDWPRCHGSWIPPLEAAALIEYTHRLVASTLGLLVLVLAVTAWLKHRGNRGIFWPSAGALVVVVLQGWIGRQVVLGELPRNLVALHFFTAMAILALLTLATVNAHSRRGGRLDGFARLAVALVAATFGVMMAGAFVAQSGAALAFPDWPLMNGALLPEVGGPAAQIHFLHRASVGMGTLLVLGVSWAAMRGRSRDRTLVATAHSALGLWVIQIAIGALNVFSRSRPWAIVLHVMVAALTWVAVVALAALAYRRARAPETAQDPAPSLREPEGSVADRVRAYVRLTKPRIIELLLITTVPAMIVAAGGWPSVWLVVATLLGGTLAAGSANAINCYVDRDIDLKMSRTATRPIPAHDVTPRAALVFGLILGVVGVAWLAFLVNPLSAVLAGGAILFYVLVYTVWLKRWTPANIVIGGAAGAAPVLIGWAAVRGEVTLAPLVMFAVVFYWTPPHFWALAIRHTSDYRAAGIPMLPVVRGVEETARRSLDYAVILLAVSFLVYPASDLGVVYLVSAALLGAVFVVFAFRLLRNPGDAAAAALFRYSITYLVLLFVAMALDTLVASPRPPGLSEIVLGVALLGFVGGNAAMLVRAAGRRPRTGAAAGGVERSVTPAAKAGDLRVTPSGR